MEGELTGESPSRVVAAKRSSEFLGTFWLVLGGCGSAVVAGAFPNFGIGFAGVALAFGLTVLSGAYASGPISGGHFNPAVTLGLWAGGRFPARDIPAYVVAKWLARSSLRDCCSSGNRAVSVISAWTLRDRADLDRAIAERSR
jgi:hypothetical protein